MDNKKTSIIDAVTEYGGAAAGAAVGAGITSILYFVTLDKIKRIEEISVEDVEVQ